MGDRVGTRPNRLYSDMGQTELTQFRYWSDRTDPIQVPVRAARNLVIQKAGSHWNPMSATQVPLVYSRLRSRTSSWVACRSARGDAMRLPNKIIQPLHMAPRA